MPYIPRPTAEAIIAAAHVHDLGKVGLQDGSLKKPSALTAEERREIEQHPVIGAEIVSRLEVYNRASTSSAIITSAGTARVIPMVSRERPFHWAPASSRWPTPSTR